MAVEIRAALRKLGKLEVSELGFGCMSYLYYPTRRQQPSKMKAFVEFALAHSRKR